MLVDAILLGTPVVVAFPAVAGLLNNEVGLESKGRLEKRLYSTLLVAEKLPAGTLGADGISRDIDRQTLQVAYAAQYPQRARELRAVALIGAAVLGCAGAYYALWWQDSGLLWLLAALGVLAVTSLWFERAMVNFARNDGVARALYEHFGAPAGFVRPRTELAAKAPALALDDVFRRAIDIRDARHDAPMSTLDAVNAALVRAHTHLDWRRELRRGVARVREVDYRAATQRATTATLRFAARAYDWLLRCVFGPFFVTRSALLAATERNRTARAQRTGDVFAAAWLPAHYRNERARLRRHWAWLHLARDPLSKWSGSVRVPRYRDVWQYVSRRFARTSPSRPSTPSSTPPTGPSSAAVVSTAPSTPPQAPTSSPSAAPSAAATPAMPS